MSSPRTILVTGGAGFIGSHITDRLLEKGYEVGVLDNLFSGNKSNLQDQHSKGRVKFHVGDITDFQFVQKVVGDYDVVIHEAAVVSVRRSVENPQLTNAVNVGGTMNLLKAAVDSKIQKFIYASSSSVYGDTEVFPKVESLNPSPVSPYGVSKLAAENYCKTFFKVYGLNTISLRYFNVYGPRQKYGPYSGVIPTFIKKIVDNNPPTIFGDGEQTRDFTFVEDVVEANMQCLERNLNGGAVYNIAGGRTVSINDLARQIALVLGKPELKPVHGPERKGDIKTSYADIGLAYRELGYKPSFSLSEGLKRVIDWFLAGHQGEWVRME